MIYAPTLAFSKHLPFSGLLNTSYRIVPDNMSVNISDVHIIMGYEGEKLV
jgi:hypothetical protein